MKNMIKLLNLNYLMYLDLEQDYGIYDIPKIDTNFTFKTEYTDYIYLYREYYDAYHDYYCVCFFDYDEEFYGKKGLFNAIYYDNDRLLLQFKRLLKPIQVFIEPDYINEEKDTNVEEIYSIFKSKIVSLYLRKVCRSKVIPLIYYKKNYLLDISLDSIEETSIVCFKYMQIDINEENEKKLIIAIDKVIDKFKELKQILIFTDYNNSNYLNNIFKNVINNNIELIIADNIYKRTNNYKK